MLHFYIYRKYTARKVSKYGVISGLYFPVAEYRKIWTRNNSVFGHFSRCEVFREYKMENEILASLLLLMMYILLFWEIYNEQWKNLRNVCEICSKLTIKITERYQWRHSGVFIVNVKQISLVFPFLTLNK